MVLGEKQWGPTDSRRLRPFAISGNIFDGMIRHQAYGNFLFFDYHVEGRIPSQVPSHVDGPLSGYPKTLVNSNAMCRSAFWGNISPEHIKYWPGGL